MFVALTFTLNKHVTLVMRHNAVKFDQNRIESESEPELDVPLITIAGANAVSDTIQ